MLLGQYKKESKMALFFLQGAAMKNKNFFRCSLMKCFLCFFFQDNGQDGWKISEWEFETVLST